MSGTPEWRASLVTLALAFCLLLPALGPPVVARAQDGDLAVAKTLLKSGRAALTKRKYTEAISLFEKALEESADLVEAEYWKATALEKTGEPGPALAAYRSFLSLLETKEEHGDASRAELGLRSKAARRVKALAAGEQELDDAEDDFARDLMKFAKRHFVRDPAISLESLRLLLAVRPEHPGAAELFEKLGGDAAAVPKRKAPAGATSSPFDDMGVGKWHDMISRKSLSKSESLSYAKGVMTIDLAGGKVIEPGENVPTAKKYVYEAELRVTAEHDRGWLAGLSFGSDGTNVFTVFMQKSQIILHSGTLDGSRREDVGDYPMRPVTKDSWHRLGVVCDGAEIEVWFDGKRVIDHTAKGRNDMKGELGVFQQRCRAEFRVLRVGRVK